MQNFEQTVFSELHKFKVQVHLHTQGLSPHTRLKTNEAPLPTKLYAFLAKVHLQRSESNIYHC